MVFSLPSVSVGVQIMGQWTGLCRPAFERRCEKQLCLEPTTLCHCQHHWLWWPSSPRPRSPVSNALQAHIKQSPLHESKGILSQSLWALFPDFYSFLRLTFMVSRSSVRLKQALLTLSKLLSWICFPDLLFIVQTKLWDLWWTSYSGTSCSKSVTPLCCSLVFCS